MKVRDLLASAFLVVLAAAPVPALKLLVEMTPRSLAREGFSLTAKRLESGALEFRLVRDLSKAVWPGRSAVLEVPGNDGKPVRRRLEPEKGETRVTYRFEVPAAEVERARLTFSEVQTDRAGNPLVGGGTIYEFRLADYRHPYPRRRSQQVSTAVP